MPKNVNAESNAIPEFNSAVKVAANAGKKQVPIAFCADANYGTYLPVVIRSVIDNSNNVDSYHIIIMDCGIKAEIVAIITAQCAERENFSLTVKDISSWMEEYKSYFREDRYLTKATYGRFAIPDLCKQYKKVIYADIDMAFNRDPAELMDVDLGGNYIGGVVDFTLECERTFEAERSRYMAETIGLKEDQFYINAGFLLLNIEAWREHNLAKICIDFLGSRHLHFLDQCAINAMCRGKIKYLDLAWNYNCWVPKNISRYGSRISASRTPSLAKLLEAWKGARENQKVVAHYLGDVKPWNSSKAFFSELWWHYASETLLYSAYLENLAKRSMQAELNSIKSRLLGVKGDKENYLDGSNLAIRYCFLGIPYWTVKQTEDGKRYCLGTNLQLAKTKRGNQNTYIYIFGIKAFSIKIRKEA